jgi:hypothetical protein
MAVPTQSTALYLDLMKRVLSDSIFIDDPLSAFVPYDPPTAMTPMKRLAFSWFSKSLARRQMRLVVPSSPYSWPGASAQDRKALREVGKDWPGRAHTMIGLKRLDNLQHCVETVLKDSVPGDFIETGVWRGGSCIFMRAILQAYGDRGRKVWVADSFAGLPAPSDQFPADTGDVHYQYSALACSQDEVAENFRRYGLLDDQVRFLKGWFKDTLPTAPIERLAILRLDGDMYESTMQALEALYDRLSPGGFVIVDDYFLKPCAQAIHDFRDRRAISDTIIDIDGMGAFWRRMS